MFCDLVSPIFPYCSTLASLWQFVPQAPSYFEQDDDRFVITSTSIRRSVPLSNTTTYPNVRRENKTFVYKSKLHGNVTVPDPYNWLEVPPSNSTETKQFCDAQAALTQRILDQCQDLTSIQKDLNDMTKYPGFSEPEIQGPAEHPLYYYRFNENLDPQATWYSATREEIMAAEKNNYAMQPPGKKFFDMNLLSENGTVTAWDFFFSHSGQKLAYTVSDAGQDMRTVYFRETSKPFIVKPSNPEEAVKGGPDRLPDELTGLKFSTVMWTTDDEGVFYNAFPSSSDALVNNNTQANYSTNDAEFFYHRVGTTQKEDIRVIAKDPVIPSSVWAPTTTRDGKWLFVGNSKDSGYQNRVYAAPLDQPISSKMKWLSISTKFEYMLNFIAQDGNDVYFFTNKDAPNWKIVRARLDPSKAKECNHVSELQDEVALEDVVKENPNATMDNAAVVGQNKLLLWYIKDVKHELYQYDLKTGVLVGRLLPDLIGQISEVKSREIDEEAFVLTTSFVTPATVYRLCWTDKGADPRALASTHLHYAATPKLLDLTAFKTRQIFVTSRDGVKIPVYLTYHKDTPMDGTAPAYVYFYGGFSVSLMPRYTGRLLYWIGSYGGVLVWVNARGGGEYGEDWHTAGSLMNKTNTFDDIIAAAQYVVDNKIAAKGKLVANGPSIGGMAALAVANMAPEGLFGAILADDSLTDLLRYQYSGAGPYWLTEYGDVEKPDMFDYMYGYSPLHHVNSNKSYPFVLLFASDQDDRVPPLHSFKMVAELQHQLPNNPQPLLLRLTADAGHGAYNLPQLLEVAAIKQCLSAQALGLTRKQLLRTSPTSK